MNPDAKDDLRTGRAYKPPTEGEDGGIYGRVGVTSALSKLARENGEGWTQWVVAKVLAEIKYLEQIPKGIARARVVFHRSQKAIEAFFKNNPEAKAKTTCFGCTSSGCCHTNVDISESEAELLASKILSGEIAVDETLMEKQAAVEDSFDGRIDAWGKLSFEERRCIFLSPEGRCRVYEDRPLMCRKWFVHERYTSACDDYNGSGWIQSVINAEIVASAVHSIESGFRLPLGIKRVLDRVRAKKENP